MTLLLAPTKVQLRVYKIVADEKIKKHLESLGITINSILSILLNQAGTTIVLVKEARYALDNNLARSIFVTPLA